ncbi:hypothetical protein [Lentilactobacillus buchneri]|uniref:hypothetical protein n=1 Tax=Lentilactobacillus buchneri TaxID=1581 RepID=UPI0021A57D18|nr:hypothetical protein [Lentilactobacillus buchneri]MCT2882635.1 hypothetical protein [Lentilactobacillus buchneri]
MDEAIYFAPRAKIGHILTEFMKKNPTLTTTELGREMGFTQSMISKIRTDKAPLRFDDLGNMYKATEGLVGNDDLMITTLNIFTNGFVPPLPNYDNLTPNPVVLANRVIEEMNQSTEALKQALDDFSDPTSPNNLDEIEDPEKAFKQTYDVIRYGLALMSVIAGYYKLSWTQEAKTREKEIERSHEHLI